MERSNSLNLAVISGTICLLFFTPTLWADLSNGDFSLGPDNLDYWDSYGVVAPDGTAIFEEVESNVTYEFFLEQTIDVEAGLQELSFDIFIESGGAETDYFDVTLGGSPIYNWDSDDESLPWTNITHHIDSLGSQNLRFNLFLDGAEPWTVVKLDNVMLTPVPSGVILGSIGLAFTSWKLRRRKEL